MKEGRLGLKLVAREKPVSGGKMGELTKAAIKVVVCAAVQWQKQQSLNPTSLDGAGRPAVALVDSQGCLLGWLID